MAATQDTSALLAKLGGRITGAVGAHKTDDTVKPQGGDLPPGIENGIAQIATVSFQPIAEGKTNAGEYIFMASGVVQEPKVFVDAQGGRHHIEGQRTSIIEPLFDTPTRSRKTVEEHVQWILNLYRLLGVDTSQMSGGNDLMAYGELLKGSGVYFKFRTWRGSPSAEQVANNQTPMTNHVWVEAVAWTPPDDAQEAAFQQTPAPAAAAAPATTNRAAQAAAAAARPNGAAPPAGRPPAAVATAASPAPGPKPGAAAKPAAAAAPAAAAPAKPAAARPAAAKPAPAPKQRTGEDTDDLDELAVMAEAPLNDQIAQAKITTAAANAAVTDDEMTATNSWADVVGLIRAKEAEQTEAADAEAGAEGAAWVPQAGERYGYTPLHPRTKKPEALVAVDVVDVDAEAGTVTLKEMEPGTRTWKKVVWTSLTDAPAGVEAPF